MNFICTENVKYSSVSAWIWVKCIHIYLAEKVAPSISFYPKSHEMLCLIFFEVFIVHDVQSMQIHVDSYLSGTKWTRLKSDFQIKKWITIGSKFMCCCLWPQFSAAVNCILFIAELTTVWTVDKTDIVHLTRKVCKNFDRRYRLENNLESACCWFYFRFRIYRIRRNGHSFEIYKWNPG